MPKYKSATSYQLSAFRRYPLVTVLAVSLSLCSALLTTMASWILGDAVDSLQFSLDNDLGITAEFTNQCWLILGIAGLLFITIIVVGYLFAIMTLRWERDARQEFFDVIQNYSMTFHDQGDSKKMLAVAMQDIRWVRFSLNPALRNIILSVGSLIIMSSLLAMIDFQNDVFPVLGIIVSIGTPLYLYLAYRYATAIEPVRRKRSEQNERITEVTQEVFRGVELVRSFGSEDFESQKFNKITKKYQQLMTKEGRLAAFYLPNLVLTATTTAAFIYGASQVINGVFTVGTLIKAVALLGSLDIFSMMLPRSLLVIRGGHVNAKRIVDILSWKDPLVEPKESLKNVAWKEDIVFDNVNFAYGGNGSALKDINITIPGGSRVALIGGPGSGKSTLLKLLLRLYDPDTGRVLVGGSDLRNVCTRDVRDAVGMVEQNVFLFRMSVRDNIAFGDMDADDQQIRLAAEKAQALEFIEELPEGFESIIGERGMTLSGGQRQRIAIARTILQDPSILLMDDSASAIDIKTEYQLRKALDKVMEGRTSITVTQRLRNLMEADLIIIMDHGRIVAHGNHEELMKSSEDYRAIFSRLPGGGA